jgi:hypothetical protein
MLYYLSQDKSFHPYLKDDVEWQKAASSNPDRGFTDDADTVENKQTAVQKVATLEQMLGLVSQWVPHYVANDIVYGSTSISSIWSCIRKYYGFQQSETNFMKFSTITWEEGERPE